MTYVPIVTPPVQSQPTSVRARQLSVELEQVIDEFQKSYPDTRPADVRDAMRLAWGGTGASAAGARTTFVALIGGVMLLGGLVAYFFTRSGEVSLGGGVPWIAVGIGVMAVLTLGVFLFNRD